MKTLITLAAGLGLASCLVGPVWAGAIIYSQDPTLSDFTSTVTSYGTFIAGFQSSIGTLSTSTTYTPTTAILLAANYPRVVGNSSNPLIVQLGSATNTIVAFDNIDHLGFGFDVFQYQILGSTDGVTYTPLFNPASVNEADNPGHNVFFTLNSFTGTAPTVLNDTITPGLGSGVGNVGYEEYFTFASSYSFYKFLPSALTLSPCTGCENELELSAVGIGTPSQTIISTATPEPGTALCVILGLAAMSGIRRLRKAGPPFLSGLRK
jgi:hypothetical protein